MTVRPRITDELNGKPDWYKPFNETGKRGRAIYWSKNRIELLADTMIYWYETNHTKVSLGAFCWAQKIPRAYISQFSRKNMYFKYCTEVIKTLLETRLLEMGMSGEIDKVMAIFSLKNVAGWADKKELHSTIEVNAKIVELQLPKKRKQVNAEYTVEDGERGRKQINTKAPEGKPSKVS